MRNQMASVLSQSLKNLPANNIEISALKELLDSDLELRSFILRRQEKAQARYTFAEKTTGVFTACLAAMSAAKDAFAASILSAKALEGTLKNTLNLYDNHHDILAPTSSTKAMLAMWAEIITLTEALLSHLDKAAPQVGTHLHLVADEHAAHESAQIAASVSMLSCTDSLRAVDRSISQKRGALFGLRLVPTEILSRIFIEAADARQHKIITSLPSYFDAKFQDLNGLSATLNLVPFTLSATCTRWRAVCQSTPQIWRYARVPIIVSSGGVKRKIIGQAQFERCVLLARKQPLNLTVYPCYDVINNGATYPNLGLLAESQIHRINIVWPANCAIPPGIPSPTELCIVASANYSVSYKQSLPTELLAKTKKLRCTGLTPQIGSAIEIKTLHISISKPGALPSLETLLQNCPQLEEVQLEITARTTTFGIILSSPHQQLHTLSLTGMALPWAISAFSAGCRLPRLTHLVLTDINGFDSTGEMWNSSSSNNQFSHITHIEVQAVSAPSVLAQLRPLFEVATALGTLTLSGSAVEPVLKLVSLSTPKRVGELLLCNSNSNGTTLREYLAAIERDGGGTSGMKVTWNDCPNFSGEYGEASGELHL